MLAGQVQRETAAGSRGRGRGKSEEVLVVQPTVCYCYSNHCNWILWSSHSN